MTEEFCARYEAERRLNNILARVEADGDFSLLDEAAVDWATFALKTFRGKRLKTALRLSVALTAFVDACSND
jgi:hypothetical protein